MNDPLQPALDLVGELRERAEDFPQSRKRDIQLYGVLAGCLRLAQILHRDGLLARHHELLPQGKFLNGTSDVYTLAAKLVFDDRSLAWRASVCLRGLGAAGVSPNYAVQYLHANGGMNSFSAERRRDLKTVTTRFLRLDKPLTLERGGTVRVELRHLKDTHFEVRVIGEDDGNETDPR